MRGGRVAVAVALIVGVWAAAAVIAWEDTEEGPARPARQAVISAVTPDGGTAPVTVRKTPLAVGPVPSELPVRVELKDPPRAGLLFDVESGEILWAVNPNRAAAIASLTKMMTGLLIAERHRARERVIITRETLGYTGSGIGVLPGGRKVALGALLHGLMLVSGNDAAIALAQHDAGGQDAFVARMNARARQLGLRCTRFASPSGIVDRGNYSCPLDLATLARLDLADPWLGEIIAKRRARFRFPVKGGVLDLFNINPFIARGDPGVTGVKTGLTSAAGRCYVITARLGGRHLGVVMLDASDPINQVPRLLQAGARAE